MAETQADTVALEFICLDFLGGGQAKPTSLVGLLEQTGLGEALAGFEKAFPAANLTVEVEPEE